MEKRNSDAVLSEITAKKEKNSSQQYTGKSFIGYLLDKLSYAIYKALIGGLFGFIFSAYYDELGAFENGSIYNILKIGSKPRKLLRRIRGYISQSFDNSYILNKIRSGVCGLADLSTKSYGRFALLFGIYTLLFYFVKLLIPAIGVANQDYLYIGIITCIISIPLLISDKTLAQAAYESRITKVIFSDLFGYREELFEVKHGTKSDAFSGQAMFLGLALGVMTFFVHPAIILTVIAIFAALVFIFTSPEIGVLISLFALPFVSLTKYPTVFLSAIIVTTTISYLIKLIRGKRVIRFEIIDVAVVLFLIALYVSGCITVGGTDSYLSALVACCLLSGYFLVVNLIRTEAWIKRCIYATVIAGTVTAFIGVLQYALGYAINNWIDVTMFTDIYGRATSTFDNPNYLATYLVVVFPFALYLFNQAKGFREKALTAISCASIVLCVVFTWSRAAWIAIIISFVAYLIIVTRKSFKYILAVIMVIPAISAFIPQSVINRFMSIGNIADSSTLYRLYTWNGCVNMIGDYFWGGIGYGQTAFENIYPLYAFAGIETAVHSHNLYLQIIISMGVGGILCFAAVMFFFAQNALSYVRAPFNENTSLIASASFISIVAMLIIGLFDFVWYNNAVFFMFWAAMAFGVAATRIGKREAARDNYVADYDDRSSSVNLYI